MKQFKVFLLNRNDFDYVVDKLWNSPHRSHFEYRPCFSLLSHLYGIRIINMDKDIRAEQFMRMCFDKAYVSKDVMDRINFGYYKDNGYIRQLLRFGGKTFIVEKFE